MWFRIKEDSFFFFKKNEKKEGDTILRIYLGQVIA